MGTILYPDGTVEPDSGTSTVPVSYFSDSDDGTYCHVRYEYSDYQNPYVLAQLPATPVTRLNTMNARVQADPGNIDWGTSPRTGIVLVAREFDGTFITGVGSEIYLTTSFQSFEVDLFAWHTEERLISAINEGRLWIGVSGFDTFGPIVGGTPFYMNVSEMWIDYDYDPISGGWSVGEELVSW